MKIVFTYQQVVVVLLWVFRILSAPIYVIPQPSVVWVPELGKNYKAQSGFSRRRLLQWHFATGYLLGSSTRGKRKRKQDWVEGEVKLTQAPLSLNHPYRELWSFISHQAELSARGFCTLTQVVMAYGPPWEECLWSRRPSETWKLKLWQLLPWTRIWVTTLVFTNLLFVSLGLTSS